MKQHIPLIGIFLAAVVCVTNTWADETNSASPLTLADAQAIALRQHPQIASADYLALAAEEAVKETRSGYFPTVNLYGTAAGVNEEGARILAGGLNNPSIYDRAAGGVQVQQLITDFGRTANLTATSRLEAKAQDQDLQLTRERVLLRLDNAYFGVLGAQAVLKVARQTVDTRQLLLDQVTALATNKMRSQLDVSFAEVQLQQARLLQEKAQDDAESAMAMLSNAMGNRDTYPYQLAEVPLPEAAVSNDVTELIQQALSQRPELLSLRDRRDAAGRFARAQRDARLPSVSAVGVAGDAPIRDSHLMEDYAAGALQLSLPLFAGGLYTARQHEAELKAQSEAALLRSLENDVIRDVRIALMNVNNALQQLQTTRELVRHAAEAFDLAQARYQNSISSIVELSEAQLNLTSAQIAEANARYALLMQQANLQYQIGALR